MPLLDLRSLFESVGAPPVDSGTEIEVTPTGQGVQGETDLLNGALGLISASRITSIDDGSTNANWCKVYYPNLRRALLRSHHWNFAEKYGVLAQRQVAPPFGFAFAYELPIDFLKIREYNGIDTTVLADPTFWVNQSGLYQIVENRTLYSNEGSVSIKYTRDVPNPAEWDPIFFQTCQHWLASLLANAVAKDAAKSRELLTQAVNFLLPLASGVDGQEGSVRPYQVPDLIWGR